MKNTRISKIKLKKTKSNEIKNNKNIGCQIINNGNNTNTINNLYFISSLNDEEIDKLTTQDKLAIFSSKDNPIIMIILKTNLNPLIPEYHNVGYTDLNSGYGYIFNGKTWEKKNIQSIMDDLLNSKRKDLFKIYEEIKEFLSEEENKSIEDRLDDVCNDIEPRLEHQVKSKRRLIINLKTNFYNNRHMIINSIKKSGKPIISTKMNDNKRNILKKGLTIDKLDKLLKQKK